MIIIIALIFSSYKYTETLENTYMYTSLDEPISNIELFYDELEISEHSRDVRGEFIPVLNDIANFPTELVEMLERGLYSLENYYNNEVENIEETEYFNILYNLGYSEFQLETEDLYNLFPQLNEYKENFNNKYDMYKFIVEDEYNIVDKDEYGYIINMFHFNDNMFVFLVHSGGSAGFCDVRFYRLEEDELILIDEFPMLNDSYGKVIKYYYDYYYVSLQYNYHLNVYDTVFLQKLNDISNDNYISISYLPEKYIWKNIYNNKPNTNLDNYINSIKAEISTDKYIEIGSNSNISIFEEDGVHTESDTNLYKIDFANINIPIYLDLVHFFPSTASSTLHLNRKFYIYDEQQEDLVSIKGLETCINSSLIQTWFKEIDGKIFTFEIYHINNYNYLLNVILVSGNNSTKIRTDIFSPVRNFYTYLGN